MAKGYMRGSNGVEVEIVDAYARGKIDGYYYKEPANLLGLYMTEEDYNAVDSNGHHHSSSAPLISNGDTIYLCFPSSYTTPLSGISFSVWQDSGNVYQPYKNSFNYTEYHKYIINEIDYFVFKFDITGLQDAPILKFVLSLTGFHNADNVYNSYEYLALSFNTEITEEVIRNGFVATIIEPTFVEAVQYAEKQKLETSDITLLQGKILLAIGDSYTYGARNHLQAIADKYGMIMDNRGIVGSTICGDESGNKGVNPMWVRVKTAIEEYKNGYVINETTYYLDDVYVITFMGGANDPYSSNWLGVGLQDRNNEYIYGALNCIYTDLLTNFLNAKVITVTQPSFTNTSNTLDSETTDEVAQLRGYRNAEEFLNQTPMQCDNTGMGIKQEAVRRCAIAYASPIVDIHATFPSIFNSVLFAKYMQEDGHPTAYGYQFICDGIDKKIEELFG